MLKACWKYDSSFFWSYTALLCSGDSVTEVNLSAVLLKETAWVLRRFLCRNTRDFGGQDLAGGRGGGRKRPPSLFSFLVENVSSSWKSGHGMHDLDETPGGGLTGVVNLGVEYSGFSTILTGVLVSAGLNIFTHIISESKVS